MTKNLDEPWRPYVDGPDVTPILKKGREEFAAMMLTSAFGGGIDANPAAGLFRNMLRLLIRSCEEYLNAVEAIANSVDARSPAYVVFAASHWEGCVESLLRAMNIAEVFRRQLGVWVPGESHLRIDKSARFTDAEFKPVRDMRHALQHLDEELVNYRPDAEVDGKGTGYFIFTEERSILFHGVEVEVASIADYLSRIGELCTWLHMQNIPAGHPLAHPERTSAVNIAGAENYQQPFTLER